MERSTERMLLSKPQRFESINFLYMETKIN